MTICSKLLRQLVRRGALPAVLLLLAMPSDGVGQASRAADDTRRSSAAASPYLSLDHPAYDALELWIARGDITTLSPFTRPYRIGDVVRAVRGLDTDRLSAAEADQRARILAEFGVRLDSRQSRRGRERRGRARRDPDRERRDDARDRGRNRNDGRSARDLRLSFGLEAGGTYVTQTHPDPLQPVFSGEFGDDRVLERLAADVRGSSPHVAGAARLQRDGVYRFDPRFPDGQVTPPREGPIVDDLSLRLEEGYVEVQIPYFRLGFGRLDRDWGPAATGGFLRSDNIYSQDELSYRFGTDRIFLVGTISSPADFGGDTVRHLAMHRLEVRPSDRLAFSISEAALHGGPDGRFRFELANPVGIWQIAVDDGEVAHNKVGQIDAWWRATDGLVLTGSLLADATNREGSCCQMGGTVGLELTRLAPGLRLGGQLTAVQSLAYRTSLPWEEYSIDGVGLGWDKSDLVLATLEADWFAAPGLLLSPRLDLQRKGEGDFRELRPPGDELDDQPRILSGIVETTFRPALGGRWTSDGLGEKSGARAFRVVAEWDLGLSIISDYANVDGDDRTEFTGSFAVRLFSPRLVFRLQ